MKKLHDYVIYLIFTLAITFGFADFIVTGVISSALIVPVLLLCLWGVVGLCEKEKVFEKKETPKPVISIEVKGKGWERDV